MNKVIDLSKHISQVNHDLCQQCTHNETCSSVCAAIETLVQLAKVRSPMAQLEYIYNIGTKLDLENSFNGIPDEQ